MNHLDVVDFRPSAKRQRVIAVACAMIAAFAIGAAAGYEPPKRRTPKVSAIAEARPAVPVNVPANANVGGGPPAAVPVVAVAPTVVAPAVVAPAVDRPAEKTAGKHHSKAEQSKTDESPAHGGAGVGNVSGVPLWDGPAKPAPAPKQAPKHVVDDNPYN